MEQDLFSVGTANNPASVHRQFVHARTYYKLPRDYEWEQQKRLYCPKNLLSSPGSENQPKLQSEFGLVFCHRGLYERSSRIVDNSAAAMEYAEREGLVLQELDVFDWDNLHQAFIAHDVNGWRVAGTDGSWADFTEAQLRKTRLVTRGVAGPEVENTDFESVCLTTDEKVLWLFDVLWKERIGPSGITVQLDLRENDLAKAMAYHSYHIHQQLLKRSHSRHRRLHDTLSGSMFQPVIFKGYNKHYHSFADLESKIIKECRRRYNEELFEQSYLSYFPPLIMVFYGKHIIPEPETTPSGLEKLTGVYQHVYRVAMEQISSFVGLCNGSYNFILEIVHTGLGLGYDVTTGEARNPLNGVRLQEALVIYNSCVDRALIDVSLDLKRQHPQLLFSSCTRLPDVTVDGKDFKAGHSTSRLEPWAEGERGLESKLRAIHGGLYPQADLVVADDPAAEIAARTWIDQHSGLDRSRLLLGRASEGVEGDEGDEGPGSNTWLPYQSWLTMGHPLARIALREINGTFLANTYGGPIDDDFLGVAGNLRPRKSQEDVKNEVRSWGMTDDDSGRHGRIQQAMAAVDEHLPRQPTPGTPLVSEGEIEQTLGTLSISGSEMEQTPGTIEMEQMPEMPFVWGNLAEQTPGTPSRRSTSESIVVFKAGDNFVFDRGAEASRAVSKLKAKAGTGTGHGLQGLSLKVAGVKFTFTTEAEAKRAILLAAGYKAACQGNHEWFVDCISPGVDVDVNAPVGLYGTMLGAACANGYGHVVQFLLDHGADVNKGRDHRCPLELASGHGYNAIVLQLLRHGARVNSTEQSHCAALAAACENGHLSTVELLLDHKADVDGGPPVPEGYTPLQAACWGGHAPIVGSLLRENADLSRQGQCLFGGEPLELAAERGHSDVVELLLKAWVLKRKCTNSASRIPGLDSGLERACLRGHGGAVRVLLDRGADANVKGSWSSPLAFPLIAACRRGDDAMVELLLSSGADVSVKAEDGRSALFHAYEIDSATIVRRLLDHGAKIDFRPQQPALKSKALPLLVEAGAQVIYEDEDEHAGQSTTSSFVLRHTLGSRLNAKHRSIFSIPRRIERRYRTAIPPVPQTYPKCECLSCQLENLIYKLKRVPLPRLI